MRRILPSALFSGFKQIWLIGLSLFTFMMLLVLIPHRSSAQILPDYTVIEGVDPVVLVEQILIGQGVQTSNITYTGVVNARGRFFGKSNLGIESGVILTSGRASYSVGPNTHTNRGDDNSSGSDPDLNQLAGGSTQDVCILEFDFIPQSTIVEFRYAFGSEEYPEYANSAYNDVFGFFISGPGIYGPFSNNAANIALVPGVLPPAYVSINNINHIHNSNWYVNNSGGQYIEYDGFTYNASESKVLVAKAIVTPCETYHIKLAIADISDGAYDSGVFLEANSFNSVGVQAALSYSHAVVDTAVENCNNATLRFQIDNLRADPFIIHYILEGEAINGVDYEYIPDSVVIAPGTLFADVEIIPISDDIPEPTKQINVIYNSSFCEYVPDTAFIWIKDYPEFELIPSQNQTIECGGTSFIRAGANGGIEPWKYVWNSGNPADTTDIISVSPQSTTTYTVHVTDECGFVQTADITVNVIGPVATITQGDTVSICLNENINLHVDGGTSWLWSTGETTQTINVAPASSSTFTATVFDECGNTDETSIHVLVGQPYANAGADQGICLGQTVTLEANDTPNGYWVWTNLITNETFVGRTWSVSPVTTTQYRVDVTDNCGNTASDFVEVDVFELDAVASVDLSEICAGQSVVLSGASSTGSGSFTWTDGTNTWSGESVTVTPNGSTTYTLTIDDGCEASSVVTVTVNPLPLVTAVSSSAAICPDDAITLTGSGAVNYSWTADPPDPTLTGASTATPQASPLESTTYTLTGTDAKGCVNTAVAGVIVKDRMYADFMVSQTAVCEGALLQINYTGNGQGYASYDWDFDGGITSGSGQGPYYVSWDNPGQKNISLTVTQLDCVSEPVSISVDVNAMPVASFSNGLPEGCIPLEVNFTSTSSGTVDGAVYSWDFGGSGTAAGENATTTFAVSGTYDVTLTVTNPGECTDVTSVSSLVHAWPLPAAGFEAAPELVSMKNPVVSFSSNSTGEGLTYSWNTGDGTLYVDSAFSHIYADSGYYQAVLTVQNQFGCTDVYEKVIYISPRYMLKIPTAFTPNGDGMNDQFLITGNGVREFRLNIYNRWGSMIFTSSSISNSWDGMVNGEPAPSGPYVYRIFFRDENDEVSEYTGSITIIK
jgi:gliding motility-associated-like protein